MTDPTPHLLLTVFRSFESSMLRTLTENGFSDISSTDLNILRHLNNDGLSITQLAKDAVISKQAVSRIINKLQQKGYLFLITDPMDQRGKKVCYTGKGRRLIVLAVEFIKQTETQYKNELGTKEYTELRQSLLDLNNIHHLN